MKLTLALALFVAGCATPLHQESSLDYPTGQTAEALQKAAPVIDCAFTPRNLRFAECAE